MKADLKLSLTIDQILDLIRQLPKEEKIKVGKELIEGKLSRLLETFETDEISEEEISDAVEEVREERYKKYRCREGYH